MSRLWRWLLGEETDPPARSGRLDHDGGSHERPSPGPASTLGGSAHEGLAGPLATDATATRGVPPGAVAFAPEGASADAGSLVAALQSASMAQSRLAAAADQLAPALVALPELVRHQSRATEATLQLTVQARERDAVLARALDEFHQGAERQTQLLRLIQQQLDLTHLTNTSVAEGLRDASIALGAYAGTSERHTRAIESLLEATRRRTRRADELERSLQTWMIITTGLSVACLAYSLFLAYRGPTAAAPTPAAAASVAAKPAADSQADGTAEAVATPVGNAGSPPATSPTSTETEQTPAEEGRDKPPVPPAPGASSSHADPSPDGGG